MDRRDFLQTSALAIGGVVVGSVSGTAEEKPAVEMHGKVMTVSGAISPDEMGFVLTHEHVLVDFIGADKVSKDRYDEDAAFERILPFLKQARELGCRTFVECTPAYLGRDPVLLKRLADASGIQILTNTGYYTARKGIFLPAHAYEETADQLADRWVKEWTEGIEGTGIRPGFIKISVDRNKEALSEVEKKVVTAAGRTHLRTGLTILSHTGWAVPAREELAILRKEGVDASAWVWTHAQGEKDNEQHKKAAESGAWIAFDGVNKKRLGRELGHVKAMKEYGLLNHVLISHDAGWYRPGEPNGGAFRPYEDMFKVFLPKLKEEGFTEEEIHLLTVENPKRAFIIRVRSL